MSVFGIGFTKRKAVARIHDLLKNLSNDTGVRFMADDTGSFLRSGLARDASGNVSQVYIGCHELLNRTFLDKYSVEDLFLVVVANAYHETGHFIQYTDKFLHDCTDDALAMSLEDIATFGNEYYYKHAIALGVSGTHAMYYYNLCELDAEKHGILKLHEYVEQEFPNVDADAAVLQYVNFKTSLSTDYFLDGEYTSYQSVLNDLDARFEFSKSLSSIYVREVQKLQEPDVAYINCQNDRRVSYDEFVDKYTDNHVNKHILQDRLIGAATLPSYPNLLQSHLNLRGLNLDLDYVIKHPLIESGSLSEQIAIDKQFALEKLRDRGIQAEDKFGSILEAASRNHDGHGGLGG